VNTLSTTILSIEDPYLLGKIVSLLLNCSENDLLNIDFVIQVDEFVKTVSGIAPFTAADSGKLRDVCRAITKANRASTFFASDFFTLLIINNKNITINQKFSLIYDLLVSFDPNFVPGQVSLEALTGVARDLYEIFMIHIPRNQLDNIVEQAVTGSVGSIREVIINGTKADISRQVLNAIANYLHLYHNTRDINLHSGAILKILGTAQGVKSQSSKNVEIVYLAGGKTHRLHIRTDQNWRPIASRASSNQEVSRLLESYRDVIELSSHPHALSKEEFVQTLQGLPLLNYLISLENLDSSSRHGAEPKNIKYTVILSDEAVYSIELKGSTHADPNTSTRTTSYRKKRFQDFQNRWAVFTRKVIDRLQGYGKHDPESYRVQRLAGAAGNIPAEKLDIYLPYTRIIQNIKKSLIKEITTELDQNIENFASYHPQLYNELLYNLDFDVSIKVNDDSERIHVSPQNSPFLTLLDIPQVVKDLEVVFNMKSTTISDPYVGDYNQLALFRLPDGTGEWLPCRISYKFIFDNSHSSEIDGYGVVFKRHPQGTY